MIASRHINREEDSLRVDVRRSKMSLLKLPFLRDLLVKRMFFFKSRSSLAELKRLIMVSFTVIKGNYFQDFGK